MYKTCIAATLPIPDFIQDLSALNRYLVDGTYTRYALLFTTNKGNIQRVCIYNTMQALLQNARAGCRVVVLEEMEKNPDQLMKWLKEALANDQAIVV